MTYYDMTFRHLSAFYIICSIAVIYGWPDGAPCLSKVMKNMYPAAPEHSGGLRTDEPPYRITVSKLCYDEGEKIRITLEAQEGYRFKGFAIQARIVGSKKRIGEFARDDNGSWKFECFEKKDAVTHSHPDLKKSVPLFWSTRSSNQEDMQFVATVVESVQSFWYQSVTSVILPHCSRGKATTVMPYGDDILYQPASRPPWDRFDPNTIEPKRVTLPSTTPSTTTQRVTATTPSGPCLDIHPSCDVWAHFCSSGNWYVIQQCRVTCKECIPEGQSKVTAALPTFVAATQATIPPPRGNCPDKDTNCIHWREMCSWRPDIQKKCSGTCNTCYLAQSFSPNNNNQASFGCVDKDFNCKGWSNMCSQFPHIRKKCKKTCKLC